MHGAIYQGNSIDRSILGLNPPDHTRLRRLAAHGFSPKQLASYEVAIEKRVEALLDAVAGRPTFDIVHAVRRPAADRRDQRPARAAGHGRRAAFEKYGQTLASILDGITSFGHGPRAPPRRSGSSGSWSGSSSCGGPTRATTWSAPWSRPRPTAQLTPRELLAMCQLLLVAGFETTVNLISNAVLALQRTPGAWEALVADPGLAALAVEETLRFDPPVQRTIRARSTTPSSAVTRSRGAPGWSG